MPTDKNSRPPINDAQKNKSEYSADKAATNKCRRRDLYKQLSHDKREAILSRRRAVNLVTKSQGRANSSSTCDSNEKTSFDIPARTTLTIREPPCLNERANIAQADDSALTPGKGKNIIGHPCIFEAGSTSGTVQQLNPDVTTARNEGTTAPCKPVVVACKNKGLGFMTSISFILLVGVFMSSWLGASVLSLGEWFIKRMPFVRHIYNASKQRSSAISPVPLFRTR